MNFSEKPNRGLGSEDVSELERGAEEARKKLADTERQADETLERAQDELRERTAEQEANAEKLRREAREPTGPLLPQPPDTES